MRPVRGPQLELLNLAFSLGDLLFELGKRGHQQHLEGTLLLFDLPNQERSLLFKMLESFIAHMVVTRVHGSRLQLQVRKAIGIVPLHCLSPC